LKNLLRTVAVAVAVAVALAGPAAALVGRTLARGRGTADADRVEVVVDDVVPVPPGSDGDWEHPPSPSWSMACTPASIVRSPRP